MTLESLGAWSGWIAGGLGSVIVAVLAWVGGASRTRRQLSGDSLAVAQNESGIDMLKTLQEREAATNLRANTLADKERTTFELYKDTQSKLEMALRDLARLRDRLEDMGAEQSDWGKFMETSIGDLPK